MNEHTVEFYIVPEFRKILEQKQELVIPLFPWFSRETSNISLAIHNDYSFKTVALYPRRPKLSEVNSETVYMKLNSDIIIAAKNNIRHGIPTFAGIPYARDWIELSGSPMWYWFDLGLLNNNDYIVEIDTDTVWANNSNIIPVKADYIYKGIDVSARTLNLTDFIYNLLKLKELGSAGRWFFSYHYKPVFFLMPVK